MFIVPFARPALLSRSLDRWFEDSRFDGATAPRSPALDLPGVAKEDVQISVEGRRVNVQAQAKRAEDKNDAHRRALYRERRVQSLSRSFALPVELNPADASAKLENGVLTLVVPKAAPRTVARIAVN